MPEDTERCLDDGQRQGVQILGTRKLWHRESDPTNYLYHVRYDSGETRQCGLDDAVEHLTCPLLPSRLIPTPVPASADQKLHIDLAFAFCFGGGQDVVQLDFLAVSYCLSSTMSTASGLL